MTTITATQTGEAEKKYCELITKNVKRQCKLTHDRNKDSNECEFRPKTSKCYVLSKSKNAKLKLKYNTQKTEEENDSTKNVENTITLEMIKDYRNIRNNSSEDTKLSYINLHQELQKQSSYDLNLGFFWIYKMGNNIPNGFIKKEDFYRIPKNVIF